VAIAGASLIAAPVTARTPHVQVRDVRLTSGDGADPFVAIHIGTSFGLLPTDPNWSDVLTALVKGVRKASRQLSPIWKIRLPAFDASLFSDQLAAGNLLGAIGDPIAAEVASIPFAILAGAARSRMPWKGPCSTSRT
jgi:hypothetical protein